MRKLFSNISSDKHSGFALIENLIAIVVLTVGTLGIAASTATAIRINTDNQARAMALAAATKTLESIYVTAETPGDVNVYADFINLVRSFVASPSSDGVAVYSNVAAGASEEFVVSVTAAVDANDKDVLTESGPYISPVTVAVLVTYQGIAGHAELDDIKTVRASFTYVLSDPPP